MDEQNVVGTVYTNYIKKKALKREGVNYVGPFWPEKLGACMKIGAIGELPVAWVISTKEVDKCSADNDTIIEFKHEPK